MQQVFVEKEHCYLKGIVWQLACVCVCVCVFGRQIFFTQTPLSKEGHETKM